MHIIEYGLVGPVPVLRVMEGLNPQLKSKQNVKSQTILLELLQFFILFGKILLSNCLQGNEQLKNYFSVMHS